MSKMPFMRSAQSGTLRKDGRWQIILSRTNPNGLTSRKTIYGKTQRECQELARAYLTAHGRNTPTEITFEGLADLMRATRWKNLSPKAVQQYEWALVRILPAIGSTRLADITPPLIFWHVGEWAKEPTLSGRSIQVLRNVIRLMLSAAVELGFIKSNAAKEVRLPVKATPATRRRLSPGEYVAILNTEQDPRLHNLWELLGETGLRPSEALSLTRSAIIYRLDLYWVQIRKGKTEAATREVPIPDSLAIKLQDQETERLFPFDLSTIEKRWKKALMNAQIPHTNLYQLRKMCLSRWIANGLADDVVKELAGHTDIRLTMNVYNRVGKTRLAEALWSVGMSKTMSGDNQNGPI